MKTQNIIKRYRMEDIIPDGAIYLFTERIYIGNEYVLFFYFLVKERIEKS